MSLRQLIIRMCANILYVLKKRELRSGRLKFLVFTGTVGKTTLRETVQHTIHGLGLPVQSNELGYSNELGILLTTLGFSRISLKNPLSWIQLIQKSVQKDSFICIELGADFYADIPWFLKHFVPYAVFIDGVARESWSRDIVLINAERTALLQAVPEEGYIYYNADDTETARLCTESKSVAHQASFSLGAHTDATAILEAWSKNMYGDRNNTTTFFDTVRIRSGEMHIDFALKRVVFEPQVHSMLAAVLFVSTQFLERVQEVQAVIEHYSFSKQRLQVTRAKNGATLIEDSYKATPLCTSWFLTMSARIPARRKILFITEMRPLTFNIVLFYTQIAFLLKHVDAVYFLGPQKYGSIIKREYPELQHIEATAYGEIAKHILATTNEEDLILLKGSYRYHLDTCKTLLT